MATTKADVGKSTGRNTVNRFVETGSANTELVTSAGSGGVHRLICVTVSYSAAPTQTGVIVELDSGAGAGYDAQLAVGTANARYTVYIPDAELIIGNDDAVRVTAPAAGGTITASIAVYLECL